MDRLIPINQVLRVIKRKSVKAYVTDATIRDDKNQVGLRERGIKRIPEQCTKCLSLLSVRILKGGDSRRIRRGSELQRCCT